MKKKYEMSTNFVVENLIKIMNIRKLSKASFADLIGFQESKWNKISNGNQSLSVDDLSKIAEKLQMREIDIYTYPDIFVELNSKKEDIKAQVTIELKEAIKQQVLELIFGNANVKILNDK
jgi:transcriptional regulator with XRE-family HTH domain